MADPVKARKSDAIKMIQDETIDSWLITGYLPMPFIFDTDHSTSRLPVIYVFGKQPVDVQDCAKNFDGFFGKDKAQKVVLMYDVIYAHCIGMCIFFLDNSSLWIFKRSSLCLMPNHLPCLDQLLKTLESEMQYTNIVKSRVETESNLGHVLSSLNIPGKAAVGRCEKKESCCSSSTSTESTGCCSGGSNKTECNSSSGCRVATSTSTSQQLGSVEEDASEHTKKRRRFGRIYDLPEGDQIEDYTLFYVGDESPTLSNIMMTHSKCDVYSYNPETKSGRLESAHVNRALMRRYFLVQKAKDADVIGIAVGTLGVGK